MLDLTALPSGIPNKSRRCEQDGEYDQRCCRYLEPTHDDRHTAQAGVLLETRRAANNVRNR